MPIYEYRCRNGHTFEVVQSMSDGPVATCEECGAPVERVFHPVAVHFKGSGFYTTDYAKKDSAKAGESKDGAAKGDSGGESKPKTEKSSSGADKAGKGSSSSSD